MRLVVCLVLLAGCMAPTPELHPLDPPANVAPDQHLMVVPEDLVEALAEQETTHLREATLQAVAEGLRVLTSPTRAEAIRAHRLETGMTVEEAILTIGSQPTAERLQGPPGGRTLLWEPPGWRSSRRLWVRFNEWGLVISAGTN